MVRDRFFHSKLSSFNLPPTSISTMFIIYMALNIALVFLTLLSPIFGMMGVIVLNLILFFLIEPRLALPLYIVVAGPTAVLSVSGAGILSRLYIGNLLFALIVGIWLLQKGLSEGKAVPAREPSILVPLMCLVFVGFLSIVYSHVFPDLHVSYSFRNSSVPLLVVNLVEMFLLISLPLFTVIVPGMVRTARDARWMIGAYIGIGTLYALGTIFAAPLGLLDSSDIILGARRPVVFGSTSSGLGILNVLFACLAFGQMLYARKGGNRLWFGLLTCIFAMGVALSFGRESWIALFLAVCVILGLRFKSPFAFLLPFLILPLLFLFTPGITDFFNPTQVYGIDRINIWQDAIAIWLHSPYMGIGAGNFQFFDIAYGTDVVGVAHNQFLSVLAEMGVQGLICLLLTIIMMGRVALKRFNTAISPMGKGIALAYLGYFAALLFATFFTDSFLPSTAAGGGTGPFIEMSYCWLFFGLVLSIPNWDQEAAKADLSVKR